MDTHDSLKRLAHLALIIHSKAIQAFSRIICGEGEIRTPEELTPLPLFESGTFDHSVTSPIFVSFQGH